MPTLSELIKEKPDYQKEFLLKFITESGNEFKVNWKEIAEYEKKHTRNQEFLEQTYSLMGDLKVLSLKYEGNYLIIGADVPINPRGEGQIMYFFTKLDDAKEFDNAFYKNAMYSRKIFQGVKKE